MIYIGADHGGVRAKKILVDFFKNKKLQYEDVGIFSTKPADYSDIANKVAREVKKNKKNKGVLICRSGVGMQIAANRHKGIRAVVGLSKKYIQMSRRDNDSNIICFSGDLQTPETMKNLFIIWIKEKFLNKPRYIRRIKKTDSRI